MGLVLLFLLATYIAIFIVGYTTGRKHELRFMKQRLEKNRVNRTSGRS